MRFKRNKREETKEVWDFGEVCDICKKEIVVHLFEKKDVKIRATIGETYPEGDSATTYELEVCSECFQEKVKPLIEATFGVSFNERYSDDYKSPAYVKEIP